MRYAMELARELAVHPDVELHVSVQQGAEEPFVGLLPGKRIWSVPGGTISRSVRETAGFLADRNLGQFDVVHGTKHLIPLHAKAGSSPLYVLTVHDTLVFDRPRDYSLSKRLLLGPPYRSSLTAADLLLADSTSTGRRLLRRFPSFTSKTVTVPLAISPRLLNGPAVPVPGLRENRYALVVGDSSPRKNLGLVIGEWQRVVDAVPGATLVIVGPPAWGHGDDSKRLGALSRAGHAVNLGFVPESQLRWLYQHAAMVLCPALVEGFGLPAAEAAAFGSPIIRSTDDAMREAAAGAGEELDPTDPGAWLAAIVKTFDRGRGREGASAPRTWESVAHETVTAVRRALERR